MSTAIDMSLLATAAIVLGGLVWVWVLTLHRVVDPLALLLGHPKDLLGASLIWVLAAALAGWSYFVLLRAACGRTLGESIWGLKVVRLDGGPPDIQSALCRGIGAIISLIPFGAGYWWSLLDPHGRNWHDRLSGTQVVEAWPHFYS